MTQLLSPSPTRAQRLLWWASGATPEVLVLCPTDHKKYAAIGAAMIIIPALAATSASFAIMQSFDSRTAAAVGGMLWGVLIFTVDRLLLISLRKEEGKWAKELFTALPRLLMIVVLSVLITDPLLHKFFESDIDYELTRQTNQAGVDAAAVARQLYGAEMDELKAVNKSLSDDLKARREFVDQKYREWMAEGEGTGGTMQPGSGRYFFEKKVAYEKAARELEDAQRATDDTAARNKTRIDELQSQLDAEVKRAAEDKGKSRGLLARNAALLYIVKHDLGAALFFVFLSLGMILLDSTPLTIKLLSKRSPYDERLEQFERELVEEAVREDKERRAVRDQESQDRIDFNRGVLALKSKKFRKVVNAMLEDKAGGLADDDSNIARELSDFVSSEIRNDIPRRERERESEAVPPSGPVTLVVRVTEPMEESFTVNFNRPKDALKGGDLLYALGGIDDVMLPENLSRPPLTAYRATSEAGTPIDPERPLFAQLNGGRCVLLSLGAQDAGEAEN